MTTQERRYVQTAIVAAIVAFGLIVGGWLIGRGFSKFRMSDRYVTVKGLAEKDVGANLAVWTINFNATGDDLAQVQNKIERDKLLVSKFLASEGLAEENFNPGRINVTDILAQSYRPQGASSQNRFIINSSINVRTDKVDMISRISQKTGELVRQGVVLSEYQGPSYIFTKLNDVKPEMIAEATANARIAAEKFATDSGSRLGKIKRARQGIFSILPRDGMGISSEQYQIDKKVRVVSTLDYYIVN